MDPTVGICLVPYCSPRGGGAVSYERGTPVLIGATHKATRHIFPGYPGIT